MFSPRTWRCFLLHPEQQYKVLVFSTHVEMFLTLFVKNILRRGFLHARGDVSLSELMIVFANMFSPRTWRCFLKADISPYNYEVFSTHVESYILDTKI